MGNNGSRPSFSENYSSSNSKATSSAKTPKAAAPSNLNTDRRAVAGKPNITLVTKVDAPDKSAAQIKIKNQQSAVSTPQGPPVGAKLDERPDLPHLPTTTSSMETTLSNVAAVEIAPKKEAQHMSPARGLGGSTGHSHPVASGSNIQLPIKSPPSPSISFPSNIYEQPDLPFANNPMDTEGDYYPALAHRQMPELPLDSMIYTDGCVARV